MAADLLECLDGIEMIAGLDACSNSVPQRLGDFSISEPIGQGAMGVVAAISVLAVGMATWIS